MRINSFKFNCSYCLNSYIEPEKLVSTTTQSQNHISFILYQNYNEYIIVCMLWSNSMHDDGIPYIISRTYISFLLLYCSIQSEVFQGCDIMHVNWILEDMVVLMKVWLYLEDTWVLWSPGRFLSSMVVVWLCLMKYDYT